MSYAHCKTHDEPATNGCPKCQAVSMVAEASDRVAETLKTYVDAFNDAHLGTGVYLNRGEVEGLEVALILTYLRGKRSCGAYAEWETYVPAALRGELG